MVHVFFNNMGCNNIIRVCVIVITVFNVCFCSESRRPSSLSESSRAQLNVVEPYTGPETILSKQISNEGVSLIIGSNYERQLKTQEPIYKCILTDLPEWYTGPELLERPRSYRINPSEERSSLENVSDYFFHFFREFWLCRDPTNENQPVFYKVVNQLISVSDIFEIKYYPYIEVAAVDYLGSNKNSAKIKEIKFIYKDGGRFYNLKFDSKLIDETVMDQTMPRRQTNPSYKEYAHSIVPMPVGSKGAVKDFLFTPINKSRKLINISPAGMNLIVGSTWHKEFDGSSLIGRTTNEFICRREYGLDFPHIFTPECSVKHHLTNSIESIYAKVTAEDFPRMFTVANREVWLCTNNDYPIYRVVNLVIGRVPIKSIEPEDDIILIDSINIANGVSVIFKEVGFFKFHSLERHDFETPYILKEDDTVRESKLRNSLFWDGRYKLPKMGIYKNIINTKGYDLRIGSKTNGALTTNDNNLNSRCEERNYFHQDFLTKLRLKMMVDDVVQSNKLIEDIDESQHFFNYKSNRVWKCKEKTTNKTFWMIVNVMEILVAVREVETFDGVELVQKPASNGTLKLLDIHETKFLDENYNPVIYLGQLEFENNAGIDEVSQKRQSDGEVLRKSLDEVAPRLGGRATRHCYTNLRDINVVYRGTNDFSPKQMGKIVGAGDSLLKFELNATIGDGDVKKEITPGFSLDCEIMKESHEKCHPNFKIFNKTNNIVYEVKLKDAVKSAEYLQFEGNEIWMCTVPEIKDFRLYRVVVNQHLKKGTHYDIGKVEYPELDEVKIENKDSDYLVRFKQIRYASSVTDVHSQIIDFRGYLFLHKSPVLGTVLSGTKILDWTNTKMMINYEKHAVDLDRQNLYIDKVIVDHSNLQTKKISLEIGSKWKRVYGNHETTMICVEEENGDSGVYPDHRPEVREKGKIVAADEKVVNLFPTYFNLLEQIRSICRPTNQRTERRILRIKNQFSMKSYREIPRTVEYLSYDDRVSVFFGNGKNTSGIGYEIIEIKYIDPEDQAVLKFQGVAENPWNVSSVLKLKSLKKEELDQNFRRDIHYSLHKPYEVYQKSFPLSFGMMLEIGQSYSSKDIVSCSLTCEHQPDPDKDLIGNHLPEVTILWGKDVAYLPMKLDRVKLNYYFHLQQIFWTCQCEKSSEPDLIRIVNILELKFEFVLSILYHHDGIAVDIEGRTSIIEETKYVRKKDKSVVKFDHYMKFQEVNPVTEKRRFMLRLPDDEVMKMTKPSSNGLSYLIGSKWQDTLPVTNDHPVICEREKAHTYSKDLATSIRTIGEQKKTGLRAWFYRREVFDLTDFVEQKLWTCKVNEEVKFRRVVNKMLIVNSTEILLIVYFDGVTVETVNLPGVNHQALQVTEIKLVAPETDKIIRYDGQFFIRSNKIVENLFQKSNEMKELGESTQSQYIPLDVLKFAAWKLISNEKSKTVKPEDGQSSVAKPKGKEFSKNKNGGETDGNGMGDDVGNLLKGFSYRPKHFKPYSTEILDAKGMYFHRIFQVGTSYEEEFLANDRSPNTGVKMQCLLDRWNPDKIHNYIPRVSEFIEGEQYLLDRDEFLELFQIKYVKVWICMDDKERYLVRVQTSFVGKEPMIAVRYPDGVTIARHKISRPDLSAFPFDIANVTEIIYLDPWSSKALKYEGDMREIGIPEDKSTKSTQSTKSDDAAPAPKTNNRIKKAWAGIVQFVFGGCWKSSKENGGK